MTTRIAASLFTLAVSAATVAQDHAPAVKEAIEHAADTHAKAGVVPTIQQGIAPMVVSLVVFAVVLGILSVKVWPMVVKGLKDRENKIREEIEAAEMARKQAKDALNEYQQSLAQARAEAQKMIEQARQQQTALAAQLKAQADIELGQLRDRARKDIEAAKRAAVAEIYAEASNLATLIASKVLKRNVSGGDTQALVDESVKQLATMKN